MKELDNNNENMSEELIKTYIVKIESLLKIETEKRKDNEYKLNKLQRDYENILYENKQLTNKYDELKNQHRKTILKQDILKNKYKNLNKRNNALKDQHKKLIKENNNLKNKQKEIFSSNSWKITAPARKLIQKLKNK